MSHPGRVSADSLHLDLCCRRSCSQSINGILSLSGHPCWWAWSGWHSGNFLISGVSPRFASHGFPDFALLDGTGRDLQLKFLQLLCGVVQGVCLNPDHELVVWWSEEAFESHFQLAGNDPHHRLSRDDGLSSDGRQHRGVAAHFANTSHRWRHATLSQSGVPSFLGSLGVIHIPCGWFFIESHARWHEATSAGICGPGQFGLIFGNDLFLLIPSETNTSVRLEAWTSARGILEGLPAAGMQLLVGVEYVSDCPSRVGEVIPPDEGREPDWNNVPGSELAIAQPSIHFGEGLRIFVDGGRIEVAAQSSGDPGAFRKLGACWLWVAQRPRQDVDLFGFSMLVRYDQNQRNPMNLQLL